MKKIAAIILLFCFFFTVIGYHLLFYIQLNDIKAEMKRSLHLFSSSEIVEFSFNEEELATIQWEDDEEFKFNHEMYDVITKYKQDDKLIIRCISDKREKALVEAYQNNHNKTSGSPAHTALLKLIVSDFIHGQHKTIHCPEKEVKHEFLNYQASLSSVSLSVLKHPPKCC